MRHARQQVPRYPSARQIRDSLERDLDRDRSYPPSTSVVMTFFCATCSEWTLEGSYAIRRCTRCHAPDPRVATTPPALE